MDLRAVVSLCFLAIAAQDVVGSSFKMEFDALADRVMKCMLMQVPSDVDCSKLDTLFDSPEAMTLAKDLVAIDDVAKKIPTMDHYKFQLTPYIKVSWTSFNSIIGSQISCPLYPVNIAQKIHCALGDDKEGKKDVMNKIILVLLKELDFRSGMCSALRPEGSTGWPTTFDDLIDHVLTFCNFGFVKKCKSLVSELYSPEARKILVNGISPVPLPVTFHTEVYRKAIKDCKEITYKNIYTRDGKKSCPTDYAQVAKTVECLKKKDTHNGRESSFTLFSKPLINELLYREKICKDAIFSGQQIWNMKFTKLVTNYGKCINDSIAGRLTRKQPMCMSKNIGNCHVVLSQFGSRPGQVHLAEKLLWKFHELAETAKRNNDMDTINTYQKTVMDFMASQVHQLCGKCDEWGQKKETAYGKMYCPISSGKYCGRRNLETTAKFISLKLGENTLFNEWAHVLEEEKAYRYRICDIKK